MSKIFLLLLLIVSVISAQSVDLFNMVSHEYAFADKAAHSSTRDAFLAFIADDGIIFRPHPVNGKEFLEKSKPNNGWLIWYPERASISASGDIGYTTGPASFRKAKGDSSDIWFGNFCTVWRKQKDNSWKFLIDFGISNLKPAANASPLKIDKSNLQVSAALTELGGKSIMKLVEAGFENSNLQARVEKYFSGSRLLVDGQQPMDGEANIGDYFAKNFSAAAKYKMIDGAVSSADDFLYAYGTVNLQDAATKVEKENYYLRVWQKQKGDWKITIEIWNEKPKD